MTLGCFLYHRMPPKVSIAWSTRHMSAARWLLAPTCIRRASTRSCRKRWRRPLLTDCCTMLTWLSPVGIASAWLRPPPAKASNRSNQRSMRRDIRRTQLLVDIRLLKHQWHSPRAAHPTSEIPGRRRQIKKPASSPHCARTRPRRERPARRTRQTPRRRRLSATVRVKHRRHRRSPRPAAKLNSRHRRAPLFVADRQGQ
jgi:hypothetical protein